MRAAVLFFAALALLLTQAQAIGKYSHSLANDLLMVSGTAYCPKEAIDEWNCVACKRVNVRGATRIANPFYGFSAVVGNAELEDLGRLNNSSAAAGWGNALVVSFRGALDLDAFVREQKFARLDRLAGEGCEGCLVQGEFQSVFRVFRDRVLEKVVERHRQGLPVALTGHGWGGALATLLAWEIKGALRWSQRPEERELSFAPVLLYTFGAPRVGNQRFARELRALLSGSFRLVNQADLITHLPPTDLTFAHLPTEAWFKKGGKRCTAEQDCQLCSDFDGEDPACSAGFQGKLELVHHHEYLGERVARLC